MATSFEQIKETIIYRRSIFQPSFIKKEIPKETILSILECANAAPNHKITQPWRFNVFQGTSLERLGDELAEVFKANASEAAFTQKKYDTMRAKAVESGAVIAISIQYSGLVPEWEEMAALGAAVQNIWLAAHAAGIGGYWGTPGFAKHMNTFLSLPDEARCLGFFFMGYHEEAPRLPNRKPVEELIIWEV